jgi:alkane 1-monooxygenase
VGTLRSALKIDSKQMIVGLCIEIALIYTIFTFYGMVSTFFFMLASSIGFILLECVNYIEHYGLQRQLNPSGRYEKVQVFHSWNSNHIIGRAILFNLSRHSDHHYMVNKKYQQLRSTKEAPQMPTGYPGMILLSLIPPLWFKIMNKKIDQ